MCGLLTNHRHGNHVLMYESTFKLTRYLVVILLNTPQIKAEFILDRKCFFIPLSHSHLLFRMRILFCEVEKWKRACKKRWKNACVVSMNSALGLYHTSLLLATLPVWWWSFYIELYAKISPSERQSAASGKLVWNQHIKVLHYSTLKCKLHRLLITYIRPGGGGTRMSRGVSGLSKN